MKTTSENHRRPRRGLIAVLCILAILAIAVPGFASVYAEDPPLDGFHDGAESDVNAAGCVAFGWAVNPDARNTDVQFRVLSDGVQVADGTANEYGDDMDTLGICPGGTCRFTINLWGLVSAGETHEITVEAHDPETDQWLALGATPRSLTCWGYPEGAHDGNEGSVDQYACNAAGWAVDPDDRDRDLQVQVLADGEPVASTSADLLREDVSACSGGTCGWFVDLWGVISPEQQHEIRAQAYDEETGSWTDLGATPKTLNCAIPFLIAFAEYEAVEAWNWPDGSSVHLAVDDPSTGDVPVDFEMDGTMAVTDWGDTRTYHRFELGGMYDLKPGDSVTVTGGAMERSHLVRNLSVVEVDARADAVSGTADAGAVIQVWPHGADQIATVQTVAGMYGNWTASLAGLFDIVGGTGGRSQILDENGSATAVDWNAPRPWFTAFPDFNVIEGWDWPLDTRLHLTVDDPATPSPVDFAAEEQVVLAPWGSGQAWVWFEFGDKYNLKVGDIVTVSGAGLSQTHTVRDLAITGVALLENTVSGIAVPESDITVWSPEDGRPVKATSDAAGIWVADFDDIGFVLQSGFTVRAESWDENGNDTAVEWTIGAGPAEPTPIRRGMQTSLPGAAGWMDTGVLLGAEEPLNITATGQVFTASLKAYRNAHSGPEGQATVCAEGCALNGAPFGALIGRIGRDGAPFLIASSYELVPESGGTLFLAVNDLEGTWDDNRGAFVVFFNR